MTMSSLYVFPDSREQGRLPVDHPFYVFVKETIQQVIDSALILHYMAKNDNELILDEAAEEQRVQGIIHYLRSNCPTVSGSDSPAMGLKMLVNTRAYLGCSKNHRGSRKLARKHIYIHKSLIHDWMALQSTVGDRGLFLTITFLTKLCLLRGLIIAVKTAFMSENDVNNNPPLGSLRPAHSFQLPCSFERFLYEWDVWVLIYSNSLKIGFLEQMIFKIGLCHVRITSNLYHDVQNKGALLRLYAGDWMGFPQVQDVPFMAFVENRRFMQIWDSPAIADPQPQEMEMSLVQSDESSCCAM